MPNHQGKVSWHPEQHYWKVNAKYLKKALSGDFSVNPSVCAEKYSQLKWSAYKRAIDAWNECDGSKRHRIKEPAVLINSDAALGNNTVASCAVAEADGSQPSSTGGA